MDKKNESLQNEFLKVLEFYKNKDYKNAEIYCYKILSINSYHFDSLIILATISVLSRNFEKAKEFLIKAIDIQPNNISAIHNLATCYKEMGNTEEAKKYYNKVLEINPKHTNSYYNLGIIFYQTKDLKLAKKYFQKTIDIQKNYGLAFFSLGNVHTDLKEYHEAISCYQKAIDINPKLVGAHNNLGLIYRTLNDFQNALNSYKKAIEIQPDHGGAYHNLALAYKELGQFNNAIKSHEAAIKSEPTNLAHYYYLSELKKDILDSELKKNINKIIVTNKSQINNAYGNYLLAKYERKSKNYEEELELLKKGHKSFFETRKNKFKLGVKYCFDDVIKINQNLEVKVLNGKKDSKIKPIFIVGVPRSGSTLIEKIIASGSKPILIGEETGIFENFINKKILEKQSLNLGRCSDIRNEINSIYENRGLISKKNNYTFTDKSLNNFFYLKFIKDIYPNAKIINCKRDVVSSIISIFQNNLAELAWTHDLENIFKYFDNYFKIIDDYNNKNPQTMYQIELEELTENPKVESKKLMKFCDLPWDEKCLEFYKRKDLISKTASNVQIRESVYKQSSNKYLPYKKFIQDLGKKYSWFK